MDFMEPAIRMNKGTVDVYPSFFVICSEDLMTRGGDFYAIWDEEKNAWSTDIFRAQELIDRELFAKANSIKRDYASIHVCDIKHADNKSVDAWRKFVTKQMPERFVMLDNSLVFANTPVTRETYSSHRLDYSLESGDYSAWDKLVGTLYTEEERLKIEWAIGAVVTGASKYIQKFLVFYGEGGAGKSTILNIIEKLFKGYTAVFDAKALGDSSQQFSLEAFASNPLVAIQHDGDLSRIEDNTKINSLVSHESMTVNQKYRSTYTASFNAFLFMASNKPVRITDSKSGLFRRLIDVHPSGKKIPFNEYQRLVKDIDYELGAIAWHCKEVYESNPYAFDGYQPTDMAMATNDMFNFVFDYYEEFAKKDGVTLNAAYDYYKKFAEETGIKYPLDRRAFANELSTYFRERKDRMMVNGCNYRNYYYGFRAEKFDSIIKRFDISKATENKNLPEWLQLKEQHSLLDDILKDCPAQESNDKGTPTYSWDKCKTTLNDISSFQEHYCRPPETMVVVDLDLKDENGNKSLERNLERASHFPETYAELSKSGVAVHLHYWYDGDVSQLASLIEEDVEIKIFTGKRSLRRKLTKCNNIDIRHISSGLPKKEAKKVVTQTAIQDEQHLRNVITKCLLKKVHADTRSNVDMIYKVLEEAYAAGYPYDLTDMINAVYTFANNSSHQWEYCTALVGKMHFKSNLDHSDDTAESEKPIAFFDVEVVPNLFYMSWKEEGPDKKMHRWFNPTPEQIDELINNYQLIGYNCRDYDNHMIWARHLGYSEEQIYRLSKRIIDKVKGSKFGIAYGLSYLDIYEVYADKTKSLKRWEIELKLKHLEWDMDFNEPVPEEKWEQLADYCDNDVYATEATYNSKSMQGKIAARLILAKLSGLAPNETQNTHTQQIIFGDDPNPQSQFFYRDLGKPIKREEIPDDVWEFMEEFCPDMVSHEWPGGSALPWFPGYEFTPKQVVEGKNVKGSSMYMGVDVGSGGRVYAEHGMYTSVGLLDITSMHPHTLIAECHFGPKYTRRFRDMVYARVHIKHKEWDICRKIFDGKLAPFIDMIERGELDPKVLSNALKIAINAVYGLTSASFATRCLDPRNKDNIVAKRGALFMTTLCEEVQKRGFQVAHIKTDSIKIPNATPDIIKFVQDFGLLYGYFFEHEATYERMCLVNNSTYIARFATEQQCIDMYGYAPSENIEEGGQWTATGAQFAVPYVFKTLFSHEALEFDDYCLTFSSSSSVGPLYIDIMEGLPDVTAEEKELDKLEGKYKKGQLSDTTFESETNRLGKIIENGHDYHFVGKIGSFCPIKEGTKHAGKLRKKLNSNGKYMKVGGAGEYNWIEVENLNKLDSYEIDDGYFKELVDNAVHDIGEFGDFEWFVNVA